MTNFCSNCGTRLVPGESFCHHCGAKVMQTNPAPARPVSQQYPNGAPRQVQQPIRQPQRQPMQPVPNQQPQNRDRPLQPTGKEHSNAMIVLTIILAVVLVVEGLVAGLWFPGFFHVGKRLFGSGRVDVQQEKRMQVLQQRNTDQTAISASAYTTAQTDPMRRISESRRSQSQNPENRHL